MIFCLFSSNKFAIRDICKLKIYKITIISISGGLIDGVEKALYSFIVEDHLAVEEGQHIDLFEVLLLHLQDDADAHEGCDRPPADRCDEDRQLYLVYGEGVIVQAVEDLVDDPIDYYLHLVEHALQVEGLGGDVSEDLLVDAGLILGDVAVVILVCVIPRLEELLEDHSELAE